MSDQISIKLGSPPWQPAPDAVPVKTFNFHDQPLIGVIEQGSGRYIFRCLEGHLDPLNLWAFTRVSSDELDRLGRTDDFDAELERIGLSHPVVIALSRDGEGIIWTEYLVNTGQFGSLTEAAIAAYKSIGNDLETLVASK